MLDPTARPSAIAAASTAIDSPAARVHAAAAARPRVSGATRRCSIGAALLDLALPAACLGCGAEDTSLCESCARPLYGRVELPPGTMLGLPGGLPIPLAQLEWCAPFTGIVRRALHALKYAGERRLSAPLAAAMAARWRVAGRGGDLFVPVPIHAERARLRGYDQAQLLAADLSAASGVAWSPSLERLRQTTPQFDLGRQARRTNVSGAFAVRSADRARVRGRWIVLVDDVVTTGSTLISCAEPLYEAGAIAVSALTVARER